jgi:hypothetical protein
VIEYEFKATDAKGLEPLDEWYVIQQVDLPEKMYKAIEHRARKYRNLRTGRIQIAPLPEVIRQDVLLGADLTAAVAFLKGSCHMSYAMVQQVFKEPMKLDLSRGLLCKAARKVSDALGPSYQEPADRLPNESQVNIDETGHHDNGKLYWTRCFDTTDYSLFKIDAAGGWRVLEDMVGENFLKIIGAD